MQSFLHPWDAFLWAAEAKEAQHSPASAAAVSADEEEEGEKITTFTSHVKMTGLSPRFYLLRGRVMSHRWIRPEISSVVHLWHTACWKGGWPNLDPKLSYGIYHGISKRKLDLLGIFSSTLWDLARNSWDIFITFLYLDQTSANSNSKLCLMIRCNQMR